MPIKRKNTVRIYYKYAYYYPIIPATFFIDLYRYLMQFYVPLSNFTSLIERSLLRNYLDAKDWKINFLVKKGKNGSKFIKIEKNRMKQKKNRK